MPVFAHYNLNDLGTTAHDSALGNGAQDGLYLNGAASDGERAVLDGQDDVVKILRDDVFQMDRGTLDIKFTIGHASEGTETIISRDSTGTTDGGFRMERLDDGTLRITHESGEGGAYSFETDAGFANEGDLIRVSYSWDQEKGGGIVIDNFTQGTGDYGDTPAGLTMDQSANYINQQWVIGAGQENSAPGIVNNLDQHFNGTVEWATFSDTVDNHEYNDDPNPQPDTAVTDEDTPVTIPVLDNDTDPNNDTLTVTDGSATHGTVTVNDDGSITYTPDQDYNGEDTITYTVRDPDGNTGTSTVTVTVNPVNDAPVAGDDAAETAFGTPVTVPVLANDTDVDGDTLLVEGTPTSPDGSVTVNDDGSITFTPDEGFSGQTTITYTVSDGNGGTDTGTVTVTVDEEIVPCFTPGALIATPRGEVPVESLKAGDQVITRDNGIQTIRWVGAKKLSWQDLAVNPHLKPILIRRGSLGNNLPERDMMVSPNHRMLVANDRTALYFDEHEVLVAAKHLVAGKGVHEVDSMGTTYLHFMFDRHEVVLANGAWTESFQPGDYTLKGMGNAQRNEIFELFPDLKTTEGRETYSAARRTLKKFEARLLTH